MSNNPNNTHDEPNADFAEPPSVEHYARKAEAALRALGLDIMSDHDIDSWNTTRNDGCQPNSDMVKAFIELNIDPLDSEDSLLPCPFCGKPVDLDDHDTLYPSGTFWRYDEELKMRTYHGAIDRVHDDGMCYGMHCSAQAGGCGAEIHGDGKEETISAWNRRPNTALTSSPIIEL